MTSHLSDVSFSSLDLAEPLLKGATDAGFRFCTPIQAQTLPVALAGKDVAGQAQTGTGKTAAFLLAMLHYLITHSASTEARGRRQPRALILAPTRELAVQIDKDLQTLGRYTNFKAVLVYGGEGYNSQREQLQAGVDILIGTPGRLIDFYKQHIFDLKSIQVVVLDEADRMFDLGFIKDIRYFLRRVPKPNARLGMLFSATLSYRVMELAYEHMNNPVLVNVKPDKVTADRVKQTMYHPSNEEKLPLLIGLLKELNPQRTLIFLNTKYGTEQLKAHLIANDFHAGVISGDVQQSARLRILHQFTDGTLPILIATDVAARGLHIPDVTHVFNYDLPQDAEDYVHRIGRTARAGAKGEAISFACEDTAYSLMDIEAYIGHKIPVGSIAPDMLTEIKYASVRRRSRAHSARRGQSSGGRRSSGQRSGPPRRGHARTRRS